MTTLVFPSSMSAALSFSHRAKERGEQVIAASSVKADETAKHYDKWIFLPSIYDGGFAKALAAAVKKHHVTDFYTPHALVHTAVKKVIKEKKLKLGIAQESPIDTLNNRYRELIERAKHANGFITGINEKCRMDTLHVSSLFHHAEAIYGQTSETKIAALVALFAGLPKGDVIEIGSAWGRSAFVLSFLARHYHTGNVLCVDPWDEGTASQKESSGDLEKLNHNLDWNLMFKIFKIHMVGLAFDNFNYLKMTSAQAAKIYGKVVDTREFGKTKFRKKISLIHIDGNHDYENVRQDYDLWRKYVQKGGWVILDDYVWEHGTGPRRVGDEVLIREAPKIDTAFTAGKALFVRFKK